MTYLIVNTDKRKIFRALERLIQIETGLSLAINSIGQLQLNPDIHIILNEKDSLGIDAVKQLQKDLLFHPLILTKQIGLIPDAQKLTIEAQNALLKSLEEPSEHTIFILTVDNQENLLSTIRSRCIFFSLEKPPIDQVETVPTILPKIVRPEILTLNLVEKFEQIEILIEKEKKNKKVIDNFLLELTEYFKAMLEESISENRIADIKKYYDIIGRLVTSERRIKANCNKRFTLENLLLQIEQIVEK